MNAGQRTVASLLAIVAVLLGLNMIVKGSPSAAGQASVGPAAQPTLVSIAVQQNPFNNDINRVFRAWSDGTVDVALRTFSSGGSCLLVDPQCGPIVVIPGSCSADVTRNGEVEVGDFLEVLGQWGPCE